MLTACTMLLLLPLAMAACPCPPAPASAKVCGSDLQTYDSQCALDCAAKPGKCRPLTWAFYTLFGTVQPEQLAATLCQHHPV
ncbi:SPARC-like protein 1 [Frankliniella fusca]|uniref:SPARC-like protein 1 n=1 Tax=Frankliniella fusca TaxID=407009 RepID=A0AAE1H6B2_9NEOP|nr:SPARC-like protein 1 [Frankliniella fusca]